MSALHPIRLVACLAILSSAACGTHTKPSSADQDRSEDLFEEPNGFDSPREYDAWGDSREHWSWAPCEAWAHRCEAVNDYWQPDTREVAMTEACRGYVHHHGEQFVLDPDEQAALETGDCQKTYDCVLTWGGYRDICDCPKPAWAIPNMSCADYDGDWEPEIIEFEGRGEKPFDPDAPEIPETIEGPADGADGI